MRTTPLILDVDDDEAGRYAVSRGLKQAGFEVVGAANGRTGMQMAERLQPDLILLDVRLPDVDGFEICKQIRAHPSISGTPIIQMSASFIDTMSRVRGLENGADAYLTEPVEPPILLATVRSLLRMKRAEQKVRQGTLQWQATFNAIQDGVAVLDAGGAIAHSNNAYAQIPAPERERLAAHAAQLFEKVRSTGARQTAEHALDGRILAVTMDPVTDDLNRCAGAVYTVADITERKNFERQLLHTAKLESIGVLAGGIAHDFNNLLTGILGNASLLLETLPAATTESQLTQEILKASESAADLTRQILAYSGQGKFVVKRVDLSAIARETRAFVRRFIPGKVELVYELAPDLPPVDADPTQIQQLMMNMIINAAESFGEMQQGVVTVRTGSEALDAGFFLSGEKPAPGEYVSLTISDTGCGMDEEMQRRIFDPFFTTKFAGRGLGLSAVHGILRGHAGYLRLESQPGKGTTFRLYFPAAPREIASPPQTSRPAAEKRSGTVLVVDDEIAVRTFARLALESRGYEVLLAETGASGVELFMRRHRNIDLVLLDLTMPGTSGEEVFDRVRQIDPEVPVVLSSGFSHEIAARRFRGKAISGFLGKPYSATQLTDAIVAALRSAASQTAP